MHMGWNYTRFHRPQPNATGSWYITLFGCLTPKTHSGWDFISHIECWKEYLIFLNFFPEYRHFFILNAERIGRERRNSWKRCFLVNWYNAIVGKDTCVWCRTKHSNVGTFRRPTYTVITQGTWSNIIHVIQGRKGGCGKVEAANVTLIQNMWVLVSMISWRETLTVKKETNPLKKSASPRLALSYHSDGSEAGTEGGRATQNEACTNKHIKLYEFSEFDIKVGIEAFNVRPIVKEAP